MFVWSGTLKSRDDGVGPRRSSCEEGMIERRQLAAAVPARGMGFSTPSVQPQILITFLWGALRGES